MGTSFLEVFFFASVKKNVNYSFLGNFPASEF